MITDYLAAEAILKDLHDVYLRAMEKGQCTVAFKIKELLGREVGLFQQKKTIDKISLDALSDEDIARLTEELEAKLNNDKQIGEMND